jgi:chemotaxis protein CheD
VSRLEAVLVGGAAMFALNGSQDIGARNAVAVNDVLSGLRIPVRGEDTGGSKGRTIKILVSAEMTTTVREAGGEDNLIYGDPARSGSPAAA